MAVEGNTTFYSIPDAETLARWAVETPADFRFCLKLPRQITHHGPLTPKLGEAIAFLEQMQGLGERLGPLLAQLPPSYGPAQFQDLTTFLTTWTAHNAALALEVRHSDWFKAPHTQRLNDLLQNLGIGRALLDTRPIYDCDDDPQVQSERRKPKLPLQYTVTADFSLIRYISHPNLELNQPYLAEWVTQIKTWLKQGKQIYFFVHCPLEVRSPHIARHFQHLLEQAQIPVPPLPWDHLSPAPTQLRLF